MESFLIYFQQVNIEVEAICTCSIKYHMMYNKSALISQLMMVRDR